MAAGARRLIEQLRSPHGHEGMWLVAGIVGAALLLAGAAIVGAIAVGNDEDSAKVAAGRPRAGAEASESEVRPGDAPIAGPDGTAPGAAGVPGAPAAGARTPAGGASGAGGSTATTTAGGAKLPAVAVPGTRIGITPSEIAWGVHAPRTLSGAPLPIADDPIKGIFAYSQYANQQGGINGRKIKVNFVDDGYTVAYARSAADTLVNQQANFMISGTLGVDQIGVIANAAKKRGVPYLAAGGYEAAFNALGVIQEGTSYDSAVTALAKFLATEPRYKGKKVGVTSLRSDFITPVVSVFKREAAKHGVNVVASVTVNKPDQQVSYINEIRDLKRGGTEVLVPLQDPISTTRIVQECRAQLCEWTYAFSNFANDSDTSLTLLGEGWIGTRGLSFGCNYTTAKADDPKFCASMGKAHKQWAAIHGEADWQENGQSGSAGYQIVNFWTKALRDAGPDPTRERFLAAIRSYDNYSDLVSGPITFKGSTNYAHGSTKVVVLEAQSNLKWKQIVPGLFDL